MRLISPKKAGYAKKSQPKEQARVGTVLLGLVSFLLGVVATMVWFQTAAKRTAPAPISPPGAPPVQASAAPPTGAGSPARTFVEKPVPVAPAALEAVKRALPNYASLSVEQGTEILREAALKRYAAAANELQRQIAQAQAELKLAESKSPAEQQAAMKHLQQVQTEQSQKLRQIGGQLQTQIAALKQLKGAAQ